MKTNQKIVLALGIGFILGHLFGFRDPLPLETAVKKAKNEIITTYKASGELPDELKSFEPFSDFELKHRDFDLYYNLSNGTVKYDEPWLYHGFVRRLTFGNFGWGEVKKGYVKYTVPKKEIDSLKNKEN